MPNQEHERERERDQIHSYWYIPSAPRVNCSLVIMESVGMMKMATGDDFPLWQGAGTGSRLVLGGYRGLRQRNYRSWFISGGFYIYRIFWHGFHVGGGGALHPPGGLGTLLVHLQCSVGFFWSKNNLRKFQVNWTPFDIPFSAILKNKEKQKLALGSRLIG